MRKLLTLSLMLILISPAFAGTLEEVTLPDSTTVNGKNLVLNGMGLRKKLFMKVYVAGLYLPSKETDAQKILGSDTERKLVMRFVRDVEKEKICHAWNDGLKNNSPSMASALKGKFDTLCSYMEEAEKGTQYIFTYVPGQGTMIRIGKAEKGTIAGKDFADALFACWIGPQPPSEDFKKGLLGQ
jgi:hypothetical protein